MGSGSFTASSYAMYSTSLGRSYDVTSGRVSGQSYTKRQLDKSLDPREFTVRECVNSDEHPNTIPVILALDVTGSMGSACKETAEALGVIITDLYKKYKDIEFCVMGIGDLAYDDAPIQMSQFESDVRIAEALDKIYMEHGGGGNKYESYTAAWYMGLYRTKLDCFDKQGRKGIIITMGDETLNPYLPVTELNNVINGTEQANIETSELYKEVCKKFDVYHIDIEHGYKSEEWSNDIRKSFEKYLGDHFKTSSVNGLSSTIVDCISNSVDNTVNDSSEISW